MSKQPETREKELRAIMYALAESVAEAADEEILAEASEEGNDPGTAAEQIRNLLRNAVKAYQQRKLREAQQQYEHRVAAMREKTYALPVTTEGRRALLTAVFARVPEMQDALLTTQHRDFTSFTDTDIESYLKQLKELGVLDDLTNPEDAKP